MKPNRVRVSSIADCRPIKMQYYPDSVSVLRVAESGNELPFVSQRMFVVHVEAAAERGRHGHKRCYQALFCVAGSCDVTVDDGKRRKKIPLSNPSRGLLIPPGIWAEQHYLSAGTILLVLCDRLYDENDYIREYDAFLRHRISIGAPVRARKVQR